MLDMIGPDNKGLIIKKWDDNVEVVAPSLNNIGMFWIPS